MTHGSVVIGAGELASVIREVASSIRRLQKPVRPDNRTESENWQILVCCIFGSATRHEDAAKAVDVLMAAEISDPSEHVLCLKSCLEDAVVESANRGGGLRFGPTRAKPSAQTYAAICTEWGSLSEMLARGDPPKELRAWLINNCPGLGAKQASLFLRDAGYTDDLAVIDTHVAKYMAIAGLGSGVAPRSRRQYEAAEERLGIHAVELGMTLGLFDQATWVVGGVMSRWK